MRLATKITLPFVALFAALLFVLGWVLAREILDEVEARVESEQRFVLEVATFPGFAFGEDTLRQIRDRAARTSERESAAHADFVVIQGGAPTISTFAAADTHGAATVNALHAALRVPPLKDSDESIAREIVTLADEKWLVLHTSRASRGPAAAPRRFFLLYPYSEIKNAQKRALLRIVSLGGVGLALAAGLGLLIAHWISNPIRRLASAAQRISSGGLNEPLEIPPVRDEIGDLAQAFKSMVESLRHSQNELLKSERLAVTGKLAASVAHEIRNPLTSLRMTVQMLQQRSTNADAATQEAYAIVLSEIDRLALAVEELLTVARPRPAQRLPTDLHRLISDTLRFLERQLAHSRVKALTELDPALPAELPLDANKVRQLLVNLILNAQQAIVRDGSITVKTRWDAAAKTATLSVSDTGPGVPEEVREKLFDLFVTTKAGGGGLGLAIAKQIAEEHHGSIRYETSPKGTTFYVTLAQE
ncbi:MAG TPA: ATP-binding protein [Planctomycetota bacterium]|nr:ATP-binding protein [Planctomycetota bacterium]